jgi:hypothetical protein
MALTSFAGRNLGMLLLGLWLILTGLLPLQYHSFVHGHNWLSGAGDHRGYTHSDPSLKGFDCGRARPLT